MAHEANSGGARPRRREVEVGAFLRSRRQRVSPEDAGLPVRGPRRVPGLRREELAALAGVSVSYYTRIEQGQAGLPSSGVLDALATALRLGADERAHLHRLTTRPSPTAAPEVETVRAGLAGIVHGLRKVPAGVLGRRMDVLAWNPLAHALFAPHIPFAAPEDPRTRPNWAWLLFCDPRCRETFVDWPRTLRDLAGRLGAATSQHPRDEDLRALIDQLHARSPEFAGLWTQHPVAEEALGSARLRHPDVGELQVRDEVLRSTEDADQLLVTFHSVPGSGTEHLLARLEAQLEPSSE
jgi:transcriptional regulator with XRE-family HTH domain